MAINQYKNSCGKIDNFFTVEQLHNIVDVFRQLDSVDGKNNDCFGIDKNHKAYLWLNKVLLKSISRQFNPDLKLIFAMFLDCVEPFDLHHDLKDIPESQGKHFLSFLIPYSVNNDTSLCSKVSTVVFNESFPHVHAVENNVSDLHENLIGHISKEMSYKITLKENLIWSLGGLYWWDSHLLHVSNNFLKDGYSSKQAIVIHTYVL
jgi:hypothetical protein